MKFPSPKRILLYVILFLISFLILFPLWSPLMTALKNSKEVITTLPLTPPSHLYLGAFKEAFNELKRSMLNSFIFTSVATVFSAFLGSMAGYILTKVKFKGSETVFFLILIGVFIPYQIVLIPLVEIMSEIGLYNTLIGLVITHTAYGIPICTLLFRNFYKYVPDSVINSAKIAGAGTWEIYRRIILPLSIMAFIVVTVFQFTSIWNNYLFGLVLTRGQKSVPATVALANLKGSYVAKWNVQMAGGMIVALPTLILYLVAGKYLIRGYMKGAIK